MIVVRRSRPSQFDNAIGPTAFIDGALCSFIRYKLTPTMHMNALAVHWGLHHVMGNILQRHKQQCGHWHNGSINILLVDNKALE